MALTTDQLYIGSRPILLLLYSFSCSSNVVMRLSFGRVFIQCDITRNLSTRPGSRAFSAHHPGEVSTTTAAAARGNRSRLFIDGVMLRGGLRVTTCMIT